MAESNPNEKTVGKKEITRYRQLLLFPQCFQKACFPGVSKGVIVWEWVNSVIFIKDNWTYCFIVFCIFKPLPFFRFNKKVRPSQFKFEIKLFDTIN